MNDVIVLRSVYGKVNQTYFIQPCPDPKSGKFPPAVKTVDSHGDMILSEDEINRMNKGEVHYVPIDHVFQIVDGTTFDLTDVVDAANWSAIKYCNWIAKDRYERDDLGNLIIDGGAKRYGVADLYVERPGEITQAKVSKKQTVFNASAYIYNDSERDRIQKAKVLGRNFTASAHPSDVLDYLLEIAEKTPKKIIELYEGEDWKIHLFILNAIERGVIRKTDNIYKYEDTMIGGSLQATIAFMKDIRYKKMIDSIKRDTYPELMPKANIQDMEKSNLDELNTLGSTPKVNKQPKK